MVYSRCIASKPFVTQSLQDDGAWYFAWNYVSLLSPRKFSRTWTSEDEDKDKDKDLKIGPRGQGLSSRTTTLQYHYYFAGVTFHSRPHHKYHRIPRSPRPYGAIVHRCCSSLSCQITRQPHLCRCRVAKQAICSHECLQSLRFSVHRIYGFMPPPPRCRES